MRTRSQDTFRELNCWEKLFWYILPNRCILCNEWKLGGKTPHRVCENYELSREEVK